MNESSESKEPRIFSGVEEVERHDGTVIIHVGSKPKWEIKIYPGANGASSCNVELIDLVNQDMPSVLRTKMTSKTLEEMRRDFRGLFITKNTAAVIKDFFDVDPPQNWYPWVESHATE